VAGSTITSSIAETVFICASQGPLFHVEQRALLFVARELDR
jgi:hypothetical protein